jgi:F-type H+-transporting ATPase subunit delta
MRVSELANRYAKAIFDLAVETKQVERITEELEILDQVLSLEGEIHNFLHSPMVSNENRMSVLKTIMQGRNFCDEVQSFILLLAKKERFAVFHQIVHGFGVQADAANSLLRGVVRSAIELTKSEKEDIVKSVERELGKKVVMTYRVDPTVVGGLVAQIGSYTFDDTIDTHLKRMNEELKRRTV